MLDLIPPWIRWLVLLGAVVGTGALIAHGIKVHDDGIRLAERTRLQAEANAAELERAQHNAATTVRRLDVQGASHETATRQLAAFAVAAARDRDVADGLRNDVAVLESVAAGAGSCDSAAVADRQAAAAAARVLADLQRRADERAEILADYGDRARIAGNTCVRDYEALTP